VHGVPSFYVLDAEGTILEIQKDLPLLDESRRCYSREKILAWLRSVEPPDRGAKTDNGD
jgi:hypothetical protein